MTRTIVLVGLLAMACGGKDSGACFDPMIPPAAEQGATCAPNGRCDGANEVSQVCWFDCQGEPATASGCAPSGYCLTLQDGTRRCTFDCPVPTCYSDWVLGGGA